MNQPTPRKPRTFVRLPGHLAEDFTPSALQAPSLEAFQQALVLGGQRRSFSAGKPAGQPQELVKMAGGTMLSADTLVVNDAAKADFLRQRGAKLYDDVQFQIFDEDLAIPTASRSRYWEPQPGPLLQESATGPGSLKDVLRHIGADEAHKRSKGDGTTIAVIDTGIHPDLPEIAADRRHPLNPDTLNEDRHWVDHEGHGSMCAVIAAAGEAGGRFTGVAPRAGVLSCRSDFSASDIAEIYTSLIEARRDGRISGPLIVNNSYGLYTCQSNGLMPDDHPFMDIINLAIDEGIVVVFAAGNNHHDVICNHDPEADGPNTIWGPNSHDRILSVGTVNRNDSNRDRSTPHVNSSRGPGEWAERYPKPDCVAPTYGEVIWGYAPRVMPWWGTSGAAPQASGLAALIQSFAVTDLGGAFRPEDVNDIIRASCKSLQAPATCVGRGRIDCNAALALALKRRQGGPSV